MAKEAGGFKMKNIVAIILGILCSMTVFAQKVVERTYVSTDKDIYVAGDWLWCSVFTMDVANGIRPTQMSSTVYLELHSASQMVATAKIALIDGRGAGRMELPNTLPTGNYKIIAYTAINGDEDGYNYDNPWAKTISIYNIFSNERIENGVEVVDEKEYSNIESPSPGLNHGVEVELTKSSKNRFSITVNNILDSAASLSISVFNNDGIISYNDVSIDDFASSLNEMGDVKLKYDVIPDYEGEVIYGRFIGADAKGLGDIRNTYALMSVPGEGSECFLSPINDDGSVRFFTGNIYGDKEIVCEIAGIDSLSESHIELITPFVDATVSAPVPLVISDCISSELLARGIAMQIEHRFEADTLFDYLPVRATSLFRDNSKTYKLDDYTRFPLMEDIFVEFIKELRVKRENGRADIQILMEDRKGDAYFSEGQSLMMLDGVPIMDNNKILSYDPLLVEKISIYPQIFCIGGKEFMGVVNFSTYNRNLPSMSFNRNVRIVNFPGVLYPMAYTASSIALSDSYPDYRQTVYWQPIVNLAPLEPYTFDCIIPDNLEHYSIVVEGITSDGEPIFWRSDL